MFSTGQLIFAGFFRGRFRDRYDLQLSKRQAASQKKYYKGSFYILIGFLVFILLLFLIKTQLNH